MQDGVLTVSGSSSVSKTGEKSDGGRERVRWRDSIACTYGKTEQLWSNFAVYSNTAYSSACGNTVVKIKRKSFVVTMLHCGYSAL